MDGNMGKKLFQNEKKERLKNGSTTDHKTSASEMSLDIYLTEVEQIAQDLTLFIDTANAPIFGIDTQGNINA
jgi:hypothetical protein